LVAADVGDACVGGSRNTLFQFIEQMKKFEYRLLDTTSGFFSGIEYQKLTDQLNHLGSQGWEVVSTVNLTSAGSTTGLLVTLKRKVGG